MPSNHTPNYQLSQWERTDKVLMEDFNADNAKIDGVLGTLAQSRNCQICYGSYVGTGESGASAPCKLAFSNKPILVHVAGDRLQNFTAVWGNPYAVDIHAAGSEGVLNLSWSDRALSWYGIPSAERQLNEKGKVYYYCALLEVQD